MVGPPAGGFWRATTHHEPFDPPPAPPPDREVDPADDESGRWDAPAGEYRVLYCATEPEGALGEKLAPFMPSLSAVHRIEAFLEDEPDPEFADDFLQPTLDAADIDSFGWLLAHARAAPAHASSMPASRAWGLRYDSRLAPRWECWALWEPLPLDADEADIQRVHIDTPALRTAAELLGVVLRS